MHELLASAHGGSTLSGSAEMVRFRSVKDPRGMLSIAEFGDELPFVVRRLYWIHSGDSDMARGGHAHRELKQVLIPMFGAFEIEIDDSHSRYSFILNDPSRGLVLMPVVWRDIRQLTPEGTLLVAASELYDEDDYFRDREQFYRFMAR